MLRNHPPMRMPVAARRCSNHITHNWSKHVLFGQPSPPLSHNKSKHVLFGLPSPPLSLRQPYPPSCRRQTAQIRMVPCATAFASAAIAPVLEDQPALAQAATTAVAETTAPSLATSAADEAGGPAGGSTKLSDETKLDQPYLVRAKRNYAAANDMGYDDGYKKVTLAMLNEKGNNVDDWSFMGIGTGARDALEQQCGRACKSSEEPNVKMIARYLPTKLQAKWRASYGAKKNFSFLRSSRIDITAHEKIAKTKWVWMARPGLVKHFSAIGADSCEESCFGKSDDWWKYNPMAKVYSFPVEIDEIHELWGERHETRTEAYDVECL